MDRREALKQTALLFGVTISPSVVAAALSGCRRSGATPDTVKPAVAARTLTLTPAQYELTATVAELIIPTTDTPGARAAGVQDFIDLVVTKFYAPHERAAFLAGLDDLDHRSRRREGKPFVEIAPASQTALLTELEAEAMKAWESGEAFKRKPFFSMVKEMTIIGYYTSEIGATIELRHVEMAKWYEGDVPFERLGRTVSFP